MIMEQSGIIIKGIGGFYYVETADGVFECRARGIFRKEKLTPVAGDRVIAEIGADGKGAVTKILERRNLLPRPAAANIDRLIIIASTAEPRPNMLNIDKMTAMAIDKDIEPAVIFSKNDLEPAGGLVDIYKKAGIASFPASAVTYEGVEELKALIKGKTCALTGNSGVGKTSLLNCIDGNLELPVGEISGKLGRGRHTTRHAELFKLAGGYIIDTPGFSSFDFDKSFYILKENLQFCFPEFLKRIGKCRFPDCSHTAENGCLIIEAVENGEISKARHDNYILIRRNCEGNEKKQY